MRDLLKGIRARVFPVGRLDFHSAGLLLLTNDGDLALRLTHPRYGIRKTYQVKVKGDPQPGQLAQLAGGVRLEDGTTNPADVHILRQRDQKAWLSITLAEGKNRQVRRMCEAVGLPVEKLVRVAFGGLRLGALPPGQWRHLEPAELEQLRRPAPPPRAVRPPRGRQRPRRDEREDRPPRDERGQRERVSAARGRHGAGPATRPDAARDHQARRGEPAREARREAFSGRGASRPHREEGPRRPREGGPRAGRDDAPRRRREETPRAGREEGARRPRAEGPRGANVPRARPRRGREDGHPSGSAAPRRGGRPSGGPRPPRRSR